MTFKKGDPRPPNAGRKKGSSKRTLRVGEVLANLGINPIERLLELMPRLPEEIQAKYWLELQSYVQGKSAKSEDDDHTDHDDSANDESTDNLMSIAKS